MTTTQIDEPTAQHSVRLWPGVVAVALQWLAWLVVPLVFQGSALYSVAGGIAGGLAVIVWWLFFSRASWAERAGAIVLMVVAVVAMERAVHPSLANGMMGMLLPIYATPPLSVTLVGWAVVTRGSSTWARRAAAATARLTR